MSTPPPAAEPGADGLRLREVDDEAARAQARELVAAAEADVGVPLLDEAEQRRLDAADWPPGWQAVLAVSGATPVAYGGLVVHGEQAGGDTAVRWAAAGEGAPLAAVLEGLADRAAAGGAERLQAWVRHAGEREAAEAARAGFAVDRRLGVLGRALDERLAPVATDAVIRASVGAQDAGAVAEVLAAAYAGTDDGGWDEAAVRARRELDWFDDADLLLAEVDDGDGPRVLGVHWTKRRGGGVGEVHNLAVHPDGQGRGLGPALLRAGLVHLAEVGCREVILWVDRANARAVRLYEAWGFTTRWDDLALGRALA